TRGEPIDDRAVAGDEDDVRDPEGPVGNALRLEQRLDRRLRAGGLLRERPVYVPAAGVLVLHAVGGAQVGLVPQVDGERGLLSVRGVAQHSLLNLVSVTADGSVSEQHRETGHADRQRRCKLDSPAHWISPLSSTPRTPSLSHISSRIRSGRGNL